MKTLADVIEFYKRPFRNITEYAQMARDGKRYLPKNLHILENPVRFHPEDTHTYHGGWQSTSFFSPSFLTFFVWHFFVSEVMTVKGTNWVSLPVFIQTNLILISGVTAFPGKGGKVYGIRNKRLYRQFKPKEEWFDFEDESFDYSRPDASMPWDPEIAEKMDRYPTKRYNLKTKLFRKVW